ncbi:MAG: NO-inducible flavohemoprotein [Proteobacteria bacterium]|nr:NO-inducible flavohemoprotein [Pseudomonadota bacterium]
MTPLRAETIEIIKATVPVLKQSGVAITTRMYDIMFARYPEVRQYFNMANQAVGHGATRASQIEAFHHQVLNVGSESGTQPLSLANAIRDYGANIEQLNALTGAIERIANKHVSINIQPEHYAVVGECLLEAMKDVLGDACTDEILAAWTEAYQLLASIFVQREDALRAQSAARPGGWVGFREFVVDRVVNEAEHIKSFYLKPADGGALPPYKPGQYTCFRLDIPGKGIEHRNYTLSDSPHRDYLRVTIKREPAARADLEPGVCSNYFHDHVREGTTLHVAPPFGEFFLTEEKSAEPLVLVSAGVGITPMLSMLNWVIERGVERDIYFIHGARNGRLHAMKGFIAETVAAHPNVRSYICYSEPGQTDRIGNDFDHKGRVTIDVLKSVVPTRECQFYFCGPVSLMTDIHRGLRSWGVAAERIHYECFGPAAAEIES